LSGKELEQYRINQLRKQYLIPKTQLSLFQIIKTHLGLHSTNYWTPYLSLYARIGDYDPKVVFDALNQGNQLVRMHAFRRTVFVVHTSNLSLLIQAMGPLLYKFARKAPDIKNMSEEELDNKIDTLCKVLEEQPLLTRNIKGVVPKIAPNLRSIIYIAHSKGKIVRATARHAKSTQTTLASMSKWVPEMVKNDYSHETALLELINNYIRVYGPVTDKDIAWWTGYSRKYLHNIIESLKKTLITFDIGKTLYLMDNEDYERCQSADPITEPLITFLPYEDHFPKAYRERSWYIDNTMGEKVYPRNAKAFWPSPAITTPNVPISRGMNQSGEIRPSIWLNHQIIGRWELDPLEKKSDGFRVVMELYQDVSSTIETIVEKKRTQLEDFINKRLIPIS
jgi:hypothetical protein